jgi:hypothetical protein
MRHGHGFQEIKSAAATSAHMLAVGVDVELAISCHEIVHEILDVFGMRNVTIGDGNSDHRRVPVLRCAGQRMVSHR